MFKSCFAVVAALTFSSPPAAAADGSEAAVINWSSQGQRHIFRKVSPTRWEAFKQNERKAWAGYTVRKHTASSLELQANATDHVTITFATRAVTLTKSGRTQAWGQMSAAFTQTGLPIDFSAASRFDGSGVVNINWVTPNGDQHWFKKQSGRWAAFTGSEPKAWAGYTAREHDARTLILDANATDYVTVDFGTKTVSVTHGGKTQRWGQVLLAFDGSNANIYTPKPVAPAAPPPAVAAKPPISRAELEGWMNWIAAEMSAVRVPYCYKETYGRGVGKPLSGRCPAGQQYDAGLCYPPCRAGYGGVANSCNGTCPGGFRDDGLFCAKPNLKTACPNGWRDIGVSCTKPSYDRGMGQPTGCGAGTERDGLLCYPRCKAGYHGNGPVCWQTCKGARGTDCASGCATSHEACVVQTYEMVEAPVAAALSLVTMGFDKMAKSGAKAGAKAAAGTATKVLANKGKWQKLGKALEKVIAAGVKVYDVDDRKNTLLNALSAELDNWTNVYAEPGTFAQATSKRIAGVIRGKYHYHPGRADYVRRQWALRHLGVLMLTDGVSTAGNILAAASAFDPTGLLYVAANYARPVCTPHVPVPEIACPGPTDCR